MRTSYLHNIYHRIYLTSKDIDNRAQGTRLLSELLTHLQQHVLSKDEGILFVMFWSLFLQIFIAACSPIKIEYLKMYTYIIN